ncbi:unnamed protein product [Rangifer tarandus platyrhynchus]|uniref:Uncharacterized protein n=2 Tax=Rangifer tarandus platyrhynchus TaxID=3082113 RepID=A0ACB0E4R8_RANTA|nr:unnamed protein product [Rangifer tarandus platyrhynchus]CAI9695301.1 unnamed protein product [Rangifer tarandus platyrhynchus]
MANRRWQGDVSGLSFRELALVDKKARGQSGPGSQHGGAPRRRSPPCPPPPPAFGVPAPPSAAHPPESPGSPGVGDRASGPNGPSNSRPVPTRAAERSQGHAPPEPTSPRLKFVQGWRSPMT